MTCIADLGRALSSGSGRAVRLMARLPRASVATAVLDACRRNTVYDPQCERNRAPWLYARVRALSLDAQLRAELAAALPATAEPRDRAQLIDLLRLMAADGDAIARAMLYECLQRGAGEFTLARAVVAVDGIDGLIAVARHAGGTLAARLDPSGLEPLLRDAAGTRDAAVAALRATADDPGVAALVQLAERNAHQEERPPSKTGGQEPLCDRRHRSAPALSAGNVATALDAWMRTIEDAAEAPQPLPATLAAATDEQLWPLVSWLTVERRSAQVLRLLASFRRRPLPVVPACAIDWAHAQDEEIRAAAIHALAQTPTFPTRDLAMDLLQGPRAETAVRDGAIRLLRGTTDPADGERVRAWLAAFGSAPADVRHDRAADVEFVAADGNAWCWVSCVEWVYDNSPCSIRRREAVRWLVDRDVARPDLLDECCHDADEGVRELALAAFERMRG